jgi:hypothetical protein
MTEVEAHKPQSKTRIERKKEVQARLGVGHSNFDTNLVLRDPADPNVPGIVRSDGSPIPRLKLIPIGPCVTGFYSADVDGLIEALRDAKRKEGWPRRSAKTAAARPSRPVPRARSVRR